MSGQDAIISFLQGGGEMGERIRAFAWSKTPLGPVGRWPQSLKTAVRIMLSSRQPIWIGWGSELNYLYNDPYKDIVGGRHPYALGRPAAEVWPETWHIIGPMLKTAMSGAQGTYVEEHPLIMERHGYREETYFTYSYTPIPDERGEAGGIICANTDDTLRVISQRQLAMLAKLSNVTANASSVGQVCELASRVFSEGNRDVSFALIHLIEPGGERACLCGAAGASLSASIARQSFSLKDREELASQFWPFAEVLSERRVVRVNNLNQRATLPGGAWPEPTQTAMVIPLSKVSGEGLMGFLVAGASPRRPLDEKYVGFFELLAGNLAGAIATVRAFEEEKKRAEELAELDRVKTAFFSNVSHEFRTPLTLMLGPVEELLSKSHTELAPAAKGQLEVVNRNGLRLLRLVNTLLDFSRIEAGRVQAVFEPTDLATFTGELASVFRSAIERAGLHFIIDCEKSFIACLH
jgi:signal transduction histidine kinase